MLNISGSFDDLPSPGIGFLEEASTRGELHVNLWSDALVRSQTGRAPKFPEAERLYFLQAIRWVGAVTVVNQIDAHEPPAPSAGNPGEGWGEGDLDGRKLFDDRYHPHPNPLPEYREKGPDKKVIVTGCYDWLHTGHVRFFQEVSDYGDLYVVVGHDANIELLKGKGHPQFSQDQRRYFVSAIRYVKEALISTGHGWMDAAPEIDRIKPDIYAVNEDGDKPEKRAFCEEHSIEYLVLKRIPKAGLAARSSTGLRGF